MSLPRFPAVWQQIVPRNIANETALKCGRTGAAVPPLGGFWASGDYRSCGEMVLKCEEGISAEAWPVSLELDLSPALWSWGVAHICKALL